jgi:hypothetical protein
MIPFAVIVIGAAMLAQLFQHSMPSFATLHDARVMIFPIILAYGSLALPYPMVLAMAFCCGLLWDLLNLLVITSTATLLKTPAIEIAVGTNVLLYGLYCTLMHGFRPLFLRGRWEVHTMLSGIFTAVMLLAEYFTLTLKRGGFELPSVIWWRSLTPAVVALVLAPIVYLFFTLIAYLLGYPVREAPRESGGLLRGHY